MDIFNLVLGMLITLMIGLGVIVGVALFVFWVRVFFHLATHKVPGKKHWIILMFLYSYVTAIVYYFKVKRKFDSRAAAGDASALPEAFPEAGKRLKTATSVGIGIWVLLAVLYAGAMLVVSFSSAKDRAGYGDPAYLAQSKVMYGGRDFYLFQSHAEVDGQLHMASDGYVRYGEAGAENVFIIKYASADPVKRVWARDIAANFLETADENTAFIEEPENLDNAEGTFYTFSYADRTGGQIVFVKVFKEDDQYGSVKVVSFGAPVSSQSIDAAFADPQAYAQTPEYASIKAYFEYFKIN